MTEYPENARPTFAVHPSLVAPPHVYITGEEALKLSSWCITTGVSIKIVGRLCRLDGLVVPFEVVQVANSDGTEKTSQVVLGEGWLINLDVLVSAGTPAAIDCPVAVMLMRGNNASAIEVGCIVQGYVTVKQRVIWPGSLGSSILPTNPSSRIRMIVGTDPAAGVEISETVPTGKRWRLMSFRATLVTSATVATRDPDLAVDDGSGNIAFLGENQTGQAASLTRSWSWAPNVIRETPAASTADTVCPFAPVTLGPGHRILTVTAALQVGDNYAAPVYLVEESDA